MQRSDFDLSACEQADWESCRVPRISVCNGDAVVLAKDVSVRVAAPVQIPPSVNDLAPK